MRITSCLLMLTLLLVSCTPYYEVAIRGSDTTDPPVDRVVPGRRVRAILNDGEVVVGVLQRVDDGGIVIERRSLPWNDIRRVDEQKQRLAGPVAAVVIGSAIVLIALIPLVALGHFPAD